MKEHNNGTIRPKKVSINDWVKQKNEPNEIIGKGNSESSETDLATYFSKDTFDLLPHFAKKIIDELETQIERSTVLFGLITLMSGVMPNFKIKYSKEYSPNLFGYLCASAGAGKGNINKLIPLVMNIHRQKRLAYERDLKEYSENKGKGSNPPKDQVLLFPADITSAKLISLLSDNDGKGIMFETETDTLTNALKKEHGQFSNILRKINEHEYISQSTKGGGTLEIECPEFSILISSTPKQLKPLIREVENGLMSRFIFYFLPTEHEFRNMFNISSEKFNEKMLRYSNSVTALYNELNSKGLIVYLELTKEQIEQFEALSKWIRTSFKTKMGEEMYATANRLAVSWLRIAMILSMVRYIDKDGKIKKIPSKIVCDNRDFKCAARMILVFKKTAEKVYNMLAMQNTQTSTHYIAKLQKAQREDEIIKGWIELAEMGLTQEEIAKRHGDGIVKSTVSRKLKLAGYEYSNKNQK